MIEEGIEFEDDENLDSDEEKEREFLQKDNLENMNIQDITQLK